MSIDYNKCAYMNAEKQNAEVMMKPCINGSDPLVWPCVERETLDKDIFSFVIERPQGDNIQETLVHSLNNVSGSQKKDNLQEVDNSEKVVNEQMFQNPNVEGFTNMGEKYIPDGRLQDGYFKCPKTGKVTQVCMNCKYNQSTYGKSKEFNEGDPCFPNNGVYNGITNDGYTDCTCGSRGQYCNNNYAGGSKRSRYAGGDNFDAQGGMMIDNIYIMNVGEFGELGNLASY